MTWLWANCCKPSWEMTWFGPASGSRRGRCGNGGARQRPGIVVALHGHGESLEYFLGDDYRAAARPCLKRLGPLDALRIAAALKKIPDHPNARQWLNKTLGKQVRLRPAFRRLSGRELRQAFEQASDEASASARQASLQ